MATRTYHTIGTIARFEAVPVQTLAGEAHNRTRLSPSRPARGLPFFVASLASIEALCARRILRDAEMIDQTTIERK